MSKAIHFTKMQGIGNDYVYINGFEENIAHPEKLARRVSDRHFGVGSDGLVLLLPSSEADVRMRMFNADGSEAEMCGNAVRCVGKIARERGLASSDEVRVATRSGLKIVRLLRRDGDICAATVDMGEPELIPARIPVLVKDGGDDARFVSRPLEVDGKTWTVTAVSMGNPHAVVFLSGIDALELAKLGPGFEHHCLFPQRTNTEFVEVLTSTRVRMRVWERGAGETLACGTGACAVTVACCLNGLTENDIEVELKGGVLRIRWDEASNHVFMTGEAATVFDGVYYDDEED
ncbi:MAG: diaminopimelate epimerase [Desulfovibrio sp.]|nr:diaminopimelate epimerase [Desulfovibrio sp.]